MKMAFIVNQKSEQLNRVKDILVEKGYTLVNSSEPDEIIQAGNQTGKLILIFEDPTFAYRFCQNNSMSGFEVLKILFLKGRPLVTADVTKKLMVSGLKLFTSGEESKIGLKISEFESQTNSTDCIEFSVIKNLEEKSIIGLNEDQDVPAKRRAR